MFLSGTIHPFITCKSIQIHDTIIQHTKPTVFVFYECENCRNGTWDDGGVCDAATEPEQDDKKLQPESWNNQYIANATKETSNPKVRLLNITYLTGFRKDGHPSKYREPGTPVGAPQDCSHWCLPGIPDTWNQILYAQLLSMDFRTK